MRNLLIVTFIIFSAVLASAQTIPAGYQEYFVVGHEQHVMNFFSTVAATEGQGCPGVTLPTSMASVVGLAASTDDQIVYYDQWEDGYEADMLAPNQSTTLILGDNNPANGDARSFSNDPRLTGDIILRGTVLTFNSDQTGGTIQNQVVPIPRVATDIRYDGGDRIFTSGGPVTLIHAEHPNQCNYIGSSLEILSRQAVGNAYSYSVPVGTNTYTRYGGAGTAGGPFKYVFIDIVAINDDTNVFVDNKGGGTASFTLQRGQHYSSQGLINTTAAPSVTILEGTKISTSQPIAGMVYTAGSGTYQDRPFALLPDLMHSTDFVVPAPGDNPGTNGNKPLNLYIYNPDSVNTISVTGTDTTGSATFTVPPNSVKAYTEATAMNRPVPNNSAARLTSSSNFWGFAAYDHLSTTVDWGHSWLATRFLTSYYSVSWSPGTSDPATAFASRAASCSTTGCDSLNRSPLFITAIQDNTRVQVDLNNDGIYDAVDTDSNDLPDAAPLPNNTYTLNALQTLKVYDQTDYDNTGTQIIANKNVVVSYGQDTDQGVDGDQSLDLGHMVYPLDQHWLDSVFTIDKTAAPGSIPLTGGTVTYLLTLHTYDFGPMQNIAVTDLMPTGGTYVVGSTTITYPGGGTNTPNPTIVGQKLTWTPSPSTMNANEVLTVQYQVSYGSSAAARVLRNTAKASGQLGAGSIFTPTASHDEIQTSVQISTVSSPGSVGTSQVLTYTTTVSNAVGGVNETGVKVTDVIPYPVTFLGSITSSNPAFTGVFSPSQNAVVWTAANFNAGATTTLSFQVTVNADVVGGLVINNVVAYDSTQTANLTANASSTVAAPILDAVLSGPSVAAPGDTLFYELTLTNNGASAATGLIINDPIPANSTYVAGSMDYRMNTGAFIALTDASDTDPGAKLASLVRLTLPTSLLPGNSVTFRFRVIANVPTPPAYVNNVASITSDQSGTDDTNLVQTLVESASLITPPPLVNSPILQGATSITGTSPSPNGTVIRVFRNGVLIGTTTVTGGTWTLSGLSSGLLLAGDEITADAKDGTKTRSNLSPPVIVSAVGLQTPAPHVLDPLYQGDTVIQGTSPSPDGTLINVYVNGVFVGQTAVVSGHWAISGVNPALVTGEVVRATAQEPGKGTSTFSNSVTVLPTPTIVKHSSANGNPVVPGQTLTYTINVANTTATPWTNLNISDPVPANTAYVAASSSVTTPVDVLVNNTYRDEFTANNVYTGSNGTLNWASSPWTEVGDDGTTGGGGIRIVADLGDNSVRMRNPNQSIYRTANLTGYTSATLTLETRRNSIEAGEQVTLEISNSGSGGPWTILQTYLGGTDDAAYVASGNINITGYISANTTIRFLTNAAYGGDGGGQNDNFYFDNVQIQASNTVRQITTSAACAPPTLIGAVGCTGYTLNPGETMVVTYQVTINTPLPPGTTDITNTATFTSTQVSSTSSSVTDYISGLPDVLRNDQTTTLASYNPSSIFVHMYPVRPAMDQWGPDAYPQEGEGALMAGNGSSDDDDFYKRAITNLWLDPDATVLTDSARPLVFYEVTCNGCTILLSKDPSGKIKITY